MSEKDNIKNLYQALEAPTNAELMGVLIELRQEFADHMTNEERAFGEIHAELKMLTRGFPKDPDTNEVDPNYHRKWHERDIKKAMDRSAMLTEIRNKVAITVLIFMLGAAGALMLTGVQVELKRAQPEASK